MKNKSPITITLNAIRNHAPCQLGWVKLLKTLGKTRADNKPLQFSTILASNGLNDTLWCLRVLEQEQRERIGGLLCDYVEHALLVFEQKFPTDTRPLEVLKVLRDNFLGMASEAEVQKAWDIIWDRGGESSGVAWDAAKLLELVGRAAEDAAWDVARDATWVPWDVADFSAELVEDLVEDLVEGAARKAERKWQAKRLIEIFG